MAEGVWVEIMKLIKNKQASQVEFIMTIEEINELIMFLKNTRKQFVKRQKDCCIKRVLLENEKIKTEKITNYNDLILSGNDFIEDHAHFSDWQDKNEQSAEPDIVIHTYFKARKNSNDTFHWENMIDL